MSADRTADRAEADVVMLADDLCAAAHANDPRRHCQECYGLANEVMDTPAFARLLDAARQGALRETADRWTQGSWSDVMLPKPTPPAVPVIAYSNRVGDWLRARADAIGGEE